MNLHIKQLNEAVEKHGKPFRVLVVDDEQWIREIFSDFCKLTKAFEVDMASDGTDALKKLESTEYDLVTLDLIMPEMSGLEVLTSIRKISATVPIMVITGNSTDKLVNTAGVLGASRVLFKPVTLDNFLAEAVLALVTNKNSGFADKAGI